MGGGNGRRRLFSAIPHDRLIQAVQERVCDQPVLKLLRAMLRAGVMDPVWFAILTPEPRKGG